MRALPRRSLKLMQILLCVALLGVPLSLAAQTMDRAADWGEREGLTRVEGESLDEVWLRDGAMLGRYRQVLLQPATVAFAPDWQRQINRSSRMLTRKLRDADVQQIIERTRKDVDAEFAAALQAAGFSLVQQPGAGVLVLAPAIVDLYLNDPGIESVGRNDVYATRAGQATLRLEARSAEGELLGLVLDHRRTSDQNQLREFSPVFTAADLRDLFGHWARTLASDLPELDRRAVITQVD